MDPKNSGGGHFADFIRAADNVRGGLSEGLRPITEAMRPITIGMRPIAEAMRPITIGMRPIAEAMRPIAEAMDGWLVLWQNDDVVRKIGWLPYQGQPMHDKYFAIVEQSAGDYLVAAQHIGEYYHSNWEEIHRHLKLRVGQGDFDEAAGDTMLVALLLHEREKYKQVPRILFPEIERLLRAASGVSGNIPLKDLLDKAFNEVSLFELVGGTSSEYSLLGGLAKWSFLSEKERDNAKRHCMPNRHLTLHGEVAYSKFQDSVNMIFFADYVMRQLSKLQITRSSGW